MATGAIAVALAAITMVILATLSAFTSALLLRGVAGATVATPEGAPSNETGDEILDRILEDVFKDVPQARSGIGRNTWVVSGSVTTTWTSYTSFTDSSFGGGVSEYFGAGGSISMQGTSGGETLNRYNSLHPGFGTSGSWVMQPRQDLRPVSSNSRKMDERILMTQLWASVMLRDNIVTVFGYILNVPKNSLTTDLYTALFHVYDAVRLRRVQTFDLIRTVQELAGSTPNDQFLILFRAMQQIVPRYLQSAIIVWREACTNDSNLVDEILRPGGGPLIVDFLAGLDASVIELLSEELVWTHPTPKFHPNVKEVFVGGTVFGDIFTALGEGKLDLSQQLFAILLANFPNNGNTAEKDETERYLVDVLRLGNVRNWNKIMKRVPEEVKMDPERLISSVLQLVAENEETDPTIREDARYLRTHIRPPSVTYANKYYDVISEVISKPSIDIVAMLKVIIPREYPYYIVKVKNRIIGYILDGQINVEFITKGFNRFDHVTPANVLIALLTRITRRLPKLSKPILRSVKTLQLFLLHKRFLSSMSSRIPENLIDVSTIVSAYDDPSLPQNITDLVNELTKKLPEENVEWDKLTQKVPIYRCVRPRQCIYSFLSLMVKKKYLPKGNSYTIIKQLLKLLDRDGNPKRKQASEKLAAEEWEYGNLSSNETGFTRRIHNTVPLISDEENGTSTSRTANALAVADIIDIVTEKSRYKLSQISDEDFIEELEDAVKRGRTIPFPTLHAVQQEEPALVQYPETCLPPTVNGSLENVKMIPAHKLLSWYRLPSLLGDDFRLERNIKKGELLLSLMEAISKLDIIKGNEDVSKYVQSYVKFIHSFRKTFSAESVIHFPSLLNALPVVKGDVERQYVAKLRNYFSKADFYKLLGSRFDPRLHKTRGKMLKYVLSLMSSLPMVKWDPILKKAIDYYADKVYMNGYGGQEVEWALVSEASEPTYVDMTVFRALDHNKMPQDALLAEYEIIRFIFIEFIPNVHLRDLNVKQFKTKGQFLKGTFQYLLLQESVQPRIKDDIQMLMQYIRMDGRGAEPLDYVDDSFM